MLIIRFQDTLKARAAILTEGAPNHKAVAAVSGAMGWARAAVFIVLAAFVADLIRIVIGVAVPALHPTLYPISVDSQSSGRQKTHQKGQTEQAA